MVEIWKDIRDYEGLYQASNWGRIRSLDRYEVVGKAKRFRKGKILKAVKTKRGYLKVGLCKAGKMKQFLVHRLVYETFNGVIPEGMDVNHINEIKTDNRYPENLNLMNRKNNINWGTGIKRRAEKRIGTKAPWVIEAKSDPVLQLTLDEELVKEWPSAAEAGRNGFSHQNISACCLGKRKTYKGFKWVKKINYKMVG